MKNKNAATHKSDEEVLKKNKSLIARTNTNGNVSILDATQDTYYFTLDGIAAKIWGLIDGRRNIKMIKDRILKQEALEPSYLNKKMNILIQDLRKQKLLQ